MDKYQESYNMLNDAQREAVDTIEGPLLVLAGPGTGKTQLLSMRAANILKKTDVDPSNILCLTFTNKAAINMQERMRKLIGPEARGIVVRTFHSLAADIMNRYPDYFWEGARLSVAPDAVQDDIIMGIVATLPHDNPLAKKFSGTFTGLKDIKTALMITKEAGLTPEELETAVRSNLEYLDILEPKLLDAMPSRLSNKLLDQLQQSIEALPSQETPGSMAIMPLNEALAVSLQIAIDADRETGKTTQTSKWKQRWIQPTDGQKSMERERNRNIWWLALADFYRKYRGVLHGRGYYDYSDMLVEVLAQLSQHPDMLADLQEEFQYIMIDEFQDTNAAQFRLADYIADHPANNNRPNLMAVGDDDQAIFAFQGAELSNVISFRERYTDVKTIVLTQNYRSTQTILDASQSIIELAQERLVHRLPDVNKKLQAQKNGSTNTIRHLNYPTAEQQFVDIAESIREQWEAGNHDIAVLASKHDSLISFSNYLQEQGIPVIYERQSNILEQDVIVQVLLIADCVAAIARGDKKSLDVHLAQLIRHPMWNIGDKTLWQLAIDNYTNPDWLTSLFDHADPTLQAIGHWLSALARRSSSQPLVQTINEMIGLSQTDTFCSPVRDYFMKDKSTTPEYIEALSGITILQAMTREFAATQATLEDFVRFIELNRTSKKVIANTSWYQTGTDAVQLLTVHGAKGLEFDSVYVIDALDTDWSPRANSRKAPANFGIQVYGEKPDDFVRLMYVAVTRAKRAISVSSFEHDVQGKPLLVTPLIGNIPVHTVTSAPKNTLEILETKLRWPSLPVAEEYDLLASRIEKFVLSPSALLDFLDITEAGPEAFKERWLLKLPREQSAAGGYGNAIHGALQTAQRLMNESQFTIDPVIDRFEAELSRQFLAPNDTQRLAQRGEKLLRAVLKKPETILPKGAKSELRLSLTLPGGEQIKGSLDQLYEDKTAVRITDYKTGAPLRSFETRNVQLKRKAWKHKTQLAFYALLAKNTPKYAQKRIETQILYLDGTDGKVSTISYEPTKEDIQRLQKLIVAVWQHIQKLKLPDTSNYPKTHEGVVSFEEDLINRKV